MQEGRRRTYGLAFLDTSASPIGVELQLELKPPSRPRVKAQRPVPRLPGQPAAKGSPSVQEAEPQPPRPIALHLVPPYQDCLLPERLHASVRSLGLVGISRSIGARDRFPDEAAINLPPVADGLGKAARDALADGAAQTILLEDLGDLTPVPSRFWRTEAAEAVFAADVETSMPLQGGRNVVGRIWLDGAALEPIWRAIAGRVAASAVLSKNMPMPAPTPWMVFMQNMARDLNYSGGYPVGEYNLGKEEVYQYIKKCWPTDNSLGAWSEDYARAMAAFILHPSNRKAGQPPTQIATQRKRFREILASEKPSTNKDIGRPRKP